jgi:hypothetical protein
VTVSTQKTPLPSLESGSLLPLYSPRTCSRSSRHKAALQPASCRTAERLRGTIFPLTFKGECLTFAQVKMQKED